MAYTVSPPTSNTGEGLATMSEDLVHFLWQKGCDTYEEDQDFFSQFEGTGSDSPIQVKTETSKGAGQTIIFPIRSGFYKEFKRSGYFEEADDYETLKVASQELEVGWFRKACRWDERAEEHMGMRGELFGEVPQMLGASLGRFKTEQMAMCMRYMAGTRNYVLPLGVNSIDELTKDHTLSGEMVTHATTKLKVMNGRPATIGTNGRNKIKSYIVVPLTEALMSLELDYSFMSQYEAADVRGDANYIFAGGFHKLRSHSIVEWNTVEHDGDGAIGTPWNPKARLGASSADGGSTIVQTANATIGAGTSALRIYGGGHGTYNEAQTLYFKWFPLWEYPFYNGSDIGDGSIYSTEAANFYLVIHNDGVPSAAGGDANKWGFYRVSANATTLTSAGGYLTIDRRLGSTASGSRVTQLGYVTWDSDVNTDQHPRGAFMFLANARALPYFRTAVMGSAFARRGFGKHRNTRGDDKKEAGFISEVFIKSVFGQHIAHDRLGQYPGFVLMTHTGQYPGIDTTNATLAETIA